MNTKLILTHALKRAAENCLWFEPPEISIKQPARLAAYILTYGGYEDTVALTEQITYENLADLLDSAPPGIFDPRSWAYWNLMAGRYQAPPMPRREL